MQDTTAPCQECLSDIPTDASTCPECGHNPRVNGRIARKTFLVLGILLTASIVGAPLGIPMLLLYAFATHVTRQKTPTGY